MHYDVIIIGSGAGGGTLAYRLSRSGRRILLLERGGYLIVIGRFIPIVRTFAPFLAGVAGMHYPRFLAYNILGGIVWVATLVYAGYLFGNIPWVKSNLSLLVVAIVVISVLPAIATFAKERRARRVPDRAD